MHGAIAAGMDSVGGGVGVQLNLNKTDFPLTQNDHYRGKFWINLKNLGFRVLPKCLHVYCWMSGEQCRP